MRQINALWMTASFLTAMPLGAVTYNCPTPDKVTLVSDGKYRGPLKGWSSGKEIKQTLPASTPYFAELKGNKLECRYNPASAVEYKGVIQAKNQKNPVKCPPSMAIAVSSETKEPHFKGRKTGEWGSQGEAQGEHSNKTQSCTYAVNSVNPPVYVERTQGISAAKCTAPAAGVKYVTCK